MSVLGWSESSSQLSLPLEANIVQTVIDYLYTDDSAKVIIQHCLTPIFNLSSPGVEK